VCVHASKSMFTECLRACVCVCVCVCVYSLAYVVCMLVCVIVLAFHLSDLQDDKPVPSIFKVVFQLGGCLNEFHPLVHSLALFHPSV